MPSTVLRRTGETARSGRISHPHGRLTVIPGGLNKPTMVTVPLVELDELHIDHVVAQAERLTFTTKVRDIVLLSLEHMAAGNIGAAHMHFETLLRLTGQEGTRALAMNDARCPCGREGAGHGDADSAALAVPAEQVA